MYKCLTVCVYSVCLYANTQMLLCYNSTVHRRRVTWKMSSNHVWFEETGLEGGNRQRASKSYKHWSSRGSGAGLEEQLLNIQRQKYRDQAWTEMKQQATFLRPSHIIHSQIKDGTSSLRVGVSRNLIVSCVCVESKKERVCLLVCTCE